MRSGELARQAGLSSDTLRHYERKGVLPKPQRAANGYRVYGPEALPRLQLVQRALAVGFSLNELAEVLAVRDRGGVPCRRVHDLAAQKLVAVEDQLRDLQRIRADLRRLLADWGQKLKRSRGERAHLLETLPAPPTRARDRLHPRTKSFGGRHK